MYQARPVPFSNKENYSDKRASRAQEKLKNRRLSRQKEFVTNRNIAVDLVQPLSKVAKGVEKLSRRELLLHWKEKKERLNKEENERKSKEKPPFKCGVVHYRPPPILDAGHRRSTRIKNMKNPIQEVKNPITKSLNATGRKRIIQPPSYEKTYQSFAPASHQFKAPNNLPKIEECVVSVSQATDSEERDGDISIFSFPAQLSPWISRIRGSDGGKRDGSDRMAAQSDRKQSPQKPCDISKGTPDMLHKLLAKKFIQKSLNTPELKRTLETRSLSRDNTSVLSKEDNESLQNFRSLYEREVDRLSTLCTHWNSLMSSDACQDIPVEVQGSIHAIVGQTRLLMREKLAQFNELLHKFELKSSKSFEVINCCDLQGFWDLVSIQVNDVDAKFTSLDALKWNNWVQAEEPKTGPEEFAVRRRAKKNNILKTKKQNTAKCSIKNYIAEQRKKNSAKEGIICGEATSRDAMQEEKHNFIMSSPMLRTNSNYTPTSILKTRSGRKMSCKREIGVTGDCITPNSSRKVTFAGTPSFYNKDNLPSAKSSNFAASKGDLITWESPKLDNVTARLRRSPRFFNDGQNSFF